MSQRYRKKALEVEAENRELIRTYRYRLYPTKGQAAALEDQLGFACDLYNAALEQRRTAWREYGVSVRLKDQQHELTELRRGLELEMNYASQEAVLKRLNYAFDAFFRRLRQGEKPGFPRFKAHGRFNTLIWRGKKFGGAKVVNGRLRLQGVGHVKVKWHRDLPSKPRETRVTRRNGRWYAAFVVETPAAPRSSTGAHVGVDLGIRQFATLSTGEVIQGPRAAWKAAGQIRRAQQRVGRRRRGSNRRRKAIAALARCKEREANRRRDAAHKAARSLVDRFDLIAVEDLARTEPSGAVAAVDRKPEKPHQRSRHYEPADAIDKAKGGDDA